MKLDDVTFSNLMGSSITAHLNGRPIAHFCNNFGDIPDPLQPNIPSMGFSFEWAINPNDTPFTKEQLVDRFTFLRRQSWEEETDFMEGGWTQWDPLSHDQWEEKNRERLARALKPFGLKIEWHDVKHAGSYWFRIVKNKKARKA